MTTYTFVANPSASTVDWNTASIWSGDAVPNDSSADVVIPAAFEKYGEYDFSEITLSEAFTVGSLSITENYLAINAGSGSTTGSLTVDGLLDVMAGAAIYLGGGSAGPGALSADSIDNGGFGVLGTGTIACSGAFDNTGDVLGTNLTLTAGSLTSTGLIEAIGGTLTVNVPAGKLSNLSGSTLGQGVWAAGDPGTSGVASTLDLNVGGVITTDAADMELLAGGEIKSWDPAKSAYEPIESTLTTVASGATLELANGADSWGPLTVDGLLWLMSSQPGFSQLNVASDGEAMGVGTLSGPITDDGTIIAGLTPAYYPGTAGDAIDTSLVIKGPVTGSGVIEIAAASVSQVGSGPATYYPWTLELGAAASADVVFADTHGLLVLDDPSGFTGAITPTGGGDEIELSGVALSSVTGDSYAGGADSGTLTLDLSGGGKIALDFTGEFDTQSFSLTGGASGVVITVGDPPVPTPDLVRDDFEGGNVSDILISNTAGAVDVGQVSAGREAYVQVSGLGAGWTFHGDGDFLGDGSSGFLIENSAGAVVVGEVSNGAVDYTRVGGLGSEWRFEGTGDFLGSNHDQFLIENTSGALVVGDVENGVAAYTQVGGLGSEWSFVGTGAYLGDGQDQFLIENTAGVVVAGDIENGKAVYTQLTALGSEWKFVGGGDFLGDGKDQFLIENTAGAVVAGEVTGAGQVTYTQLAALGPGWSFVGSGDYLGQGHDQFAIEYSNGALYVGDYSGGQIHYTEVGALGSEWSFHD